MTSQSNEAIDTLNSFLRGEISAVETYEQAIGRLASSPAVNELEECKRSHQQRVDKLRRHIMNLGGQPSGSSGPWGAFTRLFEGGAKMLGERAAIAALEEGEDHGLKLYRDDRAKLDATSRELVEVELLPAQQRTHSFLSSLKHTIH